ncbi:unnamed protein product [Medioppia subpectinata]|uniref:Uncharacterized protein n=1 Tax=Medioppia subpectinata TaxID=1979941 RepID=A0A7R9KSP8_9ACAR|nr:unnamed protein product [Medioppia subpectinata]CAG2108818.1 unnamed protein product [Medioppia subpectinata]
MAITLRDLLWKCAAICATYLAILPDRVTSYALLDIRQDEKAKLLHRLDSLNILAYTLLLILTVCTIWLFKWRRIQFLHETGLAIFYGLIVGAIIRYVGNESQVSHLSVIPEHNYTANNSQLIPPDALWIKFNVPVGDHNAMTPAPVVTNTSGPTPVGPTGTSVERYYAYVFKGELINRYDEKADRQISEKATFDPEIFFNIILPPIIFNAGYSLKRRFFFRNLGN